MNVEEAGADEEGARNNRTYTRVLEKAFELGLGLGAARFATPGSVGVGARLRRRGASGGRPTARRCAFVHASEGERASSMFLRARGTTDACAEAKKTRVKRSAEKAERRGKSMVLEGEGGGGGGGEEKKKVESGRVLS